MYNGFNLQKEKDEQSESDYVFGALSQPCIASIPENERWQYLPVGELQAGREDFTDCASRAPLNILEAKFNYLLKNSLFTPENLEFLLNNGYIEKGVEGGKITFSDRYIAILSGTTRAGNSLKAPLRAIENYGLIPKSILPADLHFTFDEYHDPSKVTEKMKSLGKEFKERFPINYEKVYEIHYKELLKDDLVVVAGYAWPQPVNGEYPRTDGEFNHAWMLFKLPAFFAYDNYPDGVDGDYVKKLADNYDFLEYGYRLYISQNNITERNSIIMQILQKIGEVLGLMKKEVEIMEKKTT